MSPTPISIKFSDENESLFHPKTKPIHQVAHQEIHMDTNIDNDVAPSRATHQKIRHGPQRRQRHRIASRRIGFSPHEPSAIRFIFTAIVLFAVLAICYYVSSFNTKEKGSGSTSNHAPAAFGRKTRRDAKETFFKKQKEQYQKCLSECGLSAALFQPFSRVMGGTPFTHSAVPFVGKLEMKLNCPKNPSAKLSSSCGAVIVAKRWVLTASHCMSYPAVWTNVCLNETVFDESEDNENLLYQPQQVTFKTKNESMKIQHFYRYKSKIAGEADLAVVKLEKEMTYTLDQRPACLISHFQEAVGQKAFFAGFGKRSNSTGIPAENDTIISGGDLNAAFFDFSMREYCQLRHPRNDGGYICAGTKARGAMPGDSGSGLFVNHNGRFYVIGIASEIEADKAAKNLTNAHINRDKYPDVFVRLSTYCSYISNKTRGAAKCMQTTMDGPSQKCITLLQSAQQIQFEEEETAGGNAVDDDEDEGSVKIEYDEQGNIVRFAEMDENGENGQKIHREGPKPISKEEPNAAAETQPISVVDEKQQNEIRVQEIIKEHAKIFRKGRVIILDPEKFDNATANQMKSAQSICELIGLQSCAQNYTATKNQQCWITCQARNESECVPFPSFVRSVSYFFYGATQLPDEFERLFKLKPYEFCGPNDVCQQGKCKEFGIRLKFEKWWNSLW